MTDWQVGNANVLGKLKWVNQDTVVAMYVVIGIYSPACSFVSISIFQICHCMCSNYANWVIDGCIYLCNPGSIFDAGCGNDGTIPYGMLSVQEKRREIDEIIGLVMSWFRDPFYTRYNVFYTHADTTKARDGRSVLHFYASGCLSLQHKSGFLVVFHSIHWFGVMQ